MTNKLLISVPKRWEGCKAVLQRKLEETVFWSSEAASKNTANKPALTVARKLDSQHCFARCEEKGVFEALQAALQKRFLLIPPDIASDPSKNL